MFDFIEGKVVETDPLSGRIVVFCSGIGFEIFTVKEVAHTGEVMRFYIEEVVRDEQRILFGFEDKPTRELFRSLTGVSGVGSASARSIISTLGTDRLAEAIAARNDSLLKSVKGIGAKTAQRIIVDLHDKINPGKIALSKGQPSSQRYEDTLAALATLGYNRAQAEKVLSQVFAEDPEANTETALRTALRMLR